MSFAEQRKMLQAHGFLGYHLGYEYYSFSNMVYIWKKSPFIPVIALPAGEFYNLTDEEILKKVWTSTVAGYKCKLEQAENELVKIVSDREMTKKNIQGTDRKAQLKLFRKMAAGVAAAKKKVVTIKENIQRYSELKPTFA